MHGKFWLCYCLHLDSCSLFFATIFFALCFLAASSLNEAVKGATYIQECTPENLEMKAKIFEDLDKALTATGNTRAYIGSSTSTLMPSKFVENLHIKDRMLVAHPV